MVKFRKPVTRSPDMIDRRGTQGRRPGVALGAGGGALAIIVAIIFALMSGGGGGLGDVLGQLQPATVDTGANPIDPATDPQADMADFMSVVLDDAQNLWSEIFQQAGREYSRATLVLFTGSTGSDCGGADSRMGPHYCPLDQTVYLDLDFFEQLRTQFGASGDLAPAYVLTHEIGHHVQNLLGTLDQVSQMQQQDPSQANELSVRNELQADCFAGVWASTVFVGQLDTGESLALDPGEISEALDAAAAVGDDRIQEAVQGQVNPESFTHGTSEQRQQWFNNGYTSGDPNHCDTFSGDI